LGPVGGLDHSPDEYIERDSILPRTQLLASLLEMMCKRRAELVLLKSQV
jgi:glutamate carboxypeptidase